MKLSISNIAWKKEQDEEMYNIIERNGYTAIEIAPTRIVLDKPYDKLKDATEFAKKIKKQYKLNISSMQSIWYGKTEKIFGSNEERKELINYTKKAIEYAKAINCNNLVFGCPKNRNINDNDERKIGIEFFREIGQYAKKMNAVFAIEPNPKIYNTNYINKTEEAIQIVKEVSCDAVKINLDIGTMIENKEDIDVLNNNYSLINHIHISEPNLEKIQKRDIHIELAKKLKENNYDKYISIEMKKGCKINEIEQIMQYVKGVF